MVIPILFIGSMTVMLGSFPIQAYQDFLDSFLGGALRSILATIQLGTVGALAVYITLALGFAYMNSLEERPSLVNIFGSLMCSIAGFLIIVGFFAGEPDLSLLSGQGVFSAMVAGLVAPVLFRRFRDAFKIRKMVFVEGADSVFNASLRIVMPFLCVVAVFAAFNYLITVCFQVQSLQHLFMKAMNAVFFRMQRSYFSGLLFIALSCVMWWFGIHGNNVLNQVAEDMFTAIIPGQIVSKSFIDTFVFMGGTGCTLGLLIAMIVFGKRSSTKKLSRMAVLPGIFNIGELFVFGFPILYNPYMLLPFILSPLLCFTNAYLVTAAGLLPQVTETVVWTTPALLGGYLATGSVTGVIVQLVNILISAACYAPFVIMYEKKSLSEFSSAYDELVDLQKKNETSEGKGMLTESEGNTGRLAKYLAIDLDDALGSSANTLSADYQLQFDNEGRCMAAEAFIKWDHGRYGRVYPPLVVQIARESGILFELESFFIEKAVSDAENYRKQYGDDFKMKMSISRSTLRDKRIIPFLQEVADRYRLRAGWICIRTEEGAGEAETDEMLRMIRAYGYSIEGVEENAL